MISDAQNLNFGQKKWELFMLSAGMYAY